MRLWLVVLCLLVNCFVFAKQQQSIVCCIGPSCSGKSTLAKSLSLSLTTTAVSWHYIDLDILVEVAANKQNISTQEVEKNSDALIIKAVNKCIENNESVVLDTNTWLDGLEKRFKSTSIKVLVYAPLSVLLQRDACRAKRLKRPKKRALRARNFVKNSYHNFFSYEHRPVQTVIDVDVHGTVVGNYAYDLLVTTSATTTENNIKKVKQALSAR